MYYTILVGPYYNQMNNIDKESETVLEIRFEKQKN